MTKRNRLKNGEVYSSRDKYIIVGNYVEINNERFHNVGAIMKVNLALYSAGIDNGHGFFSTGHNHPEDLPGPRIRKVEPSEVRELMKYLAMGRTNGLVHELKKLERIGINITHLN
ncbi:MAG: hypothetical protein AABX48_00040 [Nanoarchaeota archaeon]